MRFTLLSNFISLAGFLSIAAAQGTTTYNVYFYPNYDCSGSATDVCIVDPSQAADCCNRPDTGADSNSVLITYSGTAPVAEINWSINANPGCDSPDSYDTKYTISGSPGGQGCFNAHDASVGSVLALRPAD